MFPRKIQRMLISTFLIVVFSMNFLTVQSAPASVGVKPGDWMIHYLYYSGVPPSPRADFISREILSVNGTWIQLNYTAYLNNGTADIRIVEGNLSEGPEYIFPAVILSNLKVGDEIYSEVLDEKIIVKGEEVAEVNLQGVNFTRTLIYADFSIGTPPFPPINSTVAWDKTTGILVYMFSQQRMFNLTVRLVATNIITEDVTPSFTVDYRLIVAIATLALLVTLVSYSFLKSQGKRKKRDRG